MGTGRNRMKAARLHAPYDLRIDEVAFPVPPSNGEVLIRILSSGICGSDLHIYKTAKIGDTVVESPLILGHEFSAVIEEVGEEALDGNSRPLKKGMRVAVDPARPCWNCELCKRGHPNLCVNLQFCGNYPCDGCFCEYMVVPSTCCFPLPDEIDDDEGALLEPLGVAIHAIDLAKIKLGESVAILGAGPIGLMILALAKMAGADPVFISDKLDYRLSLASELGGIKINSAKEDVVCRVLNETSGRGVDVAIEAAWGNPTSQECVEVVRNGGRVVLVGIPEDDRLEIKHSVARRKGLTILMSRRMKHTYPRAIDMVLKKKINLKRFISHRFPLEKINNAFELNTAYKDGVIKIIIEHA